MSILYSEKLRKVKYAVILILAVAIGIFAGRFITNYETRYLLSRQFCGTYRGIDVYKCGDINELNFVGHAHMLEDAPEMLVECCSEMYFTGDELSVPTTGGSYGMALGLTQDDRVFISTYSFNADVVYHELLHAYDNAYKITETPEFALVYGSESEYLPVAAIDASSHPQEFFAVAGATYLLEPVTLEFLAPKTYAYFEQLLGETQ